VVLPSQSGRSASPGKPSRNSCTIASLSYHRARRKRPVARAPHRPRSQPNRLLRAGPATQVSHSSNCPAKHARQCCGLRVVPRDRQTPTEAALLRLFSLDVQNVECGLELVRDFHLQAACLSGNSWPRGRSHGARACDGSIPACVSHTVATVAFHRETGTSRPQARGYLLPVRASSLSS